MDLLGKIAIANSKLVYERFKQIFSGERWDKLAAQGARVQRPLWASTSTKNPDYRDTIYVDTLIGAHTVNTVPPDTLDAFLDHGVVALTVEDDLDEAHAQLNRLAELGIDLDQATEELQEEGVDKFIKPFDSLLETIASKRDRIRDVQ
jgi:transaldolase